jgi:hypothetical protein
MKFPQWYLVPHCWICWVQLKWKVFQLNFRWLIFFLKWKYTPDLIFLTVLFWNSISIWSWEESPTSNDRITVNVSRRISPHMKIATHFLSWTLSICNNGLFKVNLEFSFSFPGFSFSGLDLVFKSGFQTWDSLHISIPVLTYCKVAST